MRDVNIVGSIPRCNGKDLSYEDFLTKFMAPNSPVVLTHLCEEWRSVKDWVDDHGNPNLEFIDKRFGASEVQVAICDEKEFSDQKRIRATVSYFVDIWQNSMHHHVHCSHVPNINEASEKKPRAGVFNGESDSFYLKDWHFVKEYPEYEAYKTPHLFLDDWLNQYLDHYTLHVDEPDFSTWHLQSASSEKVECSDYRFVYIGKKGTWTPLHADVVRSFSWSANVCGRKRWLFLSPDQTPLIRHKYNSNSIYDIFEDVSSEQWPGFSQTKWLECIQEKGEIIFVPSGWFHQVWNIEDTVSINHNWFNACNIHWVWRLLKDDYAQTRASIMDIFDIVTNFEQICQRNLACNSGMNYFDFFVFLATKSHQILQHALLLLLQKIFNGHHYVDNGETNNISNNIMCYKANCESCCNVFMGKKLCRLDGNYCTRNLRSEARQCFFDLQRIKSVLSDMSSDSAFLHWISEIQYSNPNSGVCSNLNLSSGDAKEVANGSFSRGCHDMGNTIVRALHANNDVGVSERYDSFRRYIMQLCDTGMIGRKGCILQLLSHHSMSMISSNLDAQDNKSNSSSNNTNNNNNNNNIESQLSLVFAIVFSSRVEFVKDVWLSPLDLICLMNVVSKLMRGAFSDDVLDYGLVSPIPSHGSYI